MPQLNVQSAGRTSAPGQREAESAARGAKAPAVGSSATGASPSEQGRSAVSLPFQQRDGAAALGPDYSYRKIRLHKGEEVNLYAAEQDARHGLDPRAVKLIACALACAIAFLLACVLPTQVFHRATFSPAVWLAETAQGFQNFVGFFVDPDSMYASYVLTIVVTLIAGAAMGLSGGIFQGSLKNALASPSTLGVTSGGSIGAILYAVFVYPESTSMRFTGSYSEYVEAYGALSPLEQFVEQFGGFLCSLAGCTAVVALVMSIALLAGRGKVSNVALVVAGQVFTALVALVLNWVRAWLYNHGDPDMAAYLAQMQTMTFTGAYTLRSVAMFAVPMAVCMAVCLLMSRRMSLLAFNDDEARSMGVSTRATRNLVVALCTVMTALVVSFCGMVGFVGFLVPHIARKLIGPDFRYLLPACALLGAFMVTAVFHVTQLGIPYLASGSTGVLTSIIGSVAFLVIALRGRRSSGGEWL